jgi:hypothetical protein
MNCRGVPNGRAFGSNRRRVVPWADDPQWKINVASPLGMCRLYVSLLDKFNLRPVAFGDSSEPLAEVG